MKKRQFLLLVLILTLGSSFIFARRSKSSDKRRIRKIYRKGYKKNDYRGNYKNNLSVFHKVEGNILMVNNKYCRLYLDVKNANNQKEDIAAIIFNGEKTVFQGKDGYLAKQGYRNENKVIVKLRSGKELNLTLWADANMEISASKLFGVNKFDIGDPLTVKFKVTPDKGQEIKFEIFNKNNNSVVLKKTIKRERELKLPPGSFMANRDLEFRAKMFAHKNVVKTTNVNLNVDVTIHYSLLLRSTP